MTKKDNLINVSVPQSVKEGNEAARVTSALHELMEDYRFHLGANLYFEQKKEDGKIHKWKPTNVLEAGRFLQDHAGKEIRIGVDTTKSVGDIRVDLGNKVSAIMRIPESTESSGRKAA